MAGLDQPWFTLGVLVAISLFATVTALAIQYFAGKSLASILIGPFVAAVAVFVFSKCWAKNDDLGEISATE